MFTNSLGVHVDKNGVAVAFKKLQERDRERFKEVLGADAETPADLLRAAAFDPRLPMHLRLEYAHKAAPYFTAKRLAVTAPPGVLSPDQQAARIRDALAAMDASVGVDPAAPKPPSTKAKGK